VASRQHWTSGVILRAGSLNGPSNQKPRTDRQWAAGLADSEGFCPPIPVCSQAVRSDRIHALKLHLLVAGADKSGLFINRLS
jgi:hypothetical protein